MNTTASAPATDVVPFSSTSTSANGGTTPAPGTVERVEQAVREFLAATDISPGAVEQELDELRKRDLGTYLDAFASCLDRLASLIGAAAPQAEQFTGSEQVVVDAQNALVDAHEALLDLTNDLGPGA